MPEKQQLEGRQGLESGERVLGENAGDSIPATTEEFLGPASPAP